MTKFYYKKKLLNKSYQKKEIDDNSDDHKLIDIKLIMKNEEKNFKEINYFDNKKNSLVKENITIKKMNSLIPNYIFYINKSSDNNYSIYNNHKFKNERNNFFTEMNENIKSILGEWSLGLKAKENSILEAKNRISFTTLDILISP